MSRSTRSVLVGLAAAGVLAASCFSPAEPVRTRWFSPPLDPIAAPDERGADRPELRAGRVTAAAHLGAPMVWRLSDVEVSIDPVNRWVDEPAALVERVLDAAVFGSGGFAPGGRDAPELRAHLAAFEAVLDTPARVRVAVQLTLEPADATGMRRTSIVAERPLAGTTPEDVARALGDALGDVARRAAVWCEPADGG